MHLSVFQSACTRVLHRFFFYFLFYSFVFYHNQLTCRLHRWTGMLTDWLSSDRKSIFTVEVWGMVIRMFEFQIKRDWYAKSDMRLFSSSLSVLFLLPLVSGQGEDKSEEESAKLLAIPISCREVIFKLATDPVTCSKVSCIYIAFDSWILKLVLIPRFPVPLLGSTAQRPIRRMVGRFLT